MKSPLVLLFILSLAAIIVFAIYISWGPPAAAGSEPGQSAPRYCRDGQTQACSAGSCSGLSTCINGIWSGCKWGTVCTPLSRVPCLSNGCVYAVKECNSCGTGYGDCFLPNATAPPAPTTQ